MYELSEIIYPKERENKHKYICTKEIGHIWIDI